jgi:hypothetical protein
MKTDEKLDIEVGDVIRYGAQPIAGVIVEIRIIDTAKLVEKFSGDTQNVMLKIRTKLGTASFWPKEQPLEKAGEHEAKEFKAKLKTGYNS